MPRQPRSRLFSEGEVFHAAVVEQRRCQRSIAA
jgi:hypothetical protein